MKLIASGGLRPFENTSLNAQRLEISAVLIRQRFKRERERADNIFHGSNKREQTTYFTIHGSTIVKRIQEAVSGGV